MDLELAGRSVIVTGASRGIGLSIAEAFAAEGARLTICARGADGLEAARARLAERGAEVVAVQADIMDEDDCVRVVDAAVDAYGGIDALVNNAGGRAGEGSAENVLRGTIEVNAVTAFRLAELAQAAPRGGGERRRDRQHLLDLRSRERRRGRVQRRQGRADRDLQGARARLDHRRHPRQQRRAGLDRLRGRLVGPPPARRPGRDGALHRPGDPRRPLRPPRGGRRGGRVPRLAARLVGARRNGQRRRRSVEVEHLAAAR